MIPPQNFIQKRSFSKKSHRRFFYVIFQKPSNINYHFCKLLRLGLLRFVSFKIYLLEKATKRLRHTRKELVNWYSKWWVIVQLIATARTWVGSKVRATESIQVSMWMSGAKMVGSPSTAIPGILAGTLIESRVARPPIGNLIWDFNLLSTNLNIYTCIYINIWLLFFYDES